ncbi:MAG: WD40 repeat domain-containing protein [Planctomycetota bacterium]
MLDVDDSMIVRGLLIESWYVAFDDYIIDLAWAPDATKIAAVTVEGSVFLIDDLGESARFKLIGQHDGGANSVSWRCDGAEFATSGHDGLTKVWDGTSGEGLCSLEAGDAWVSKSIYSPRRHVLATAAGRQLKLWNERREVFYESLEHSSTIADVGWNPKGPGVAVAANNGVTLHLSDSSTHPRKFKWRGSSLVLEWSPDSRFLVTGDQDATVHFWYRESGKDAQMRGFPGKVLALSWDSTGRWLATGAGEIFLLWDCGGEGPAGRQPRQYAGHANKVNYLAFQPVGHWLATADAGGFLFLWDPSDHDKVIGGVMLSSPASCLRWCGDNRLAVGQQDGKVVVFEVGSGSGD